MEISYRKSDQKASPRSLFNFGKQPKIAIAYKEFFKKRYIERVLSKSIKKLSLFFFQTQSLLMDKIMKNKSAWN